MAFILAAAVSAVVCASTPADGQKAAADTAPASALLAHTTGAITASAHLVYKLDPATPFASDVVVIEQSRELVVVDADSVAPSKESADPTKRPAPACRPAARAELTKG